MPSLRISRVLAGLSRILLVSGAALLTSAGHRAAAQDATTELERLGDALKAAVISGAMSEGEATRVYVTLAERLEGGKGGAGKGSASGGEDDWSKDGMLLSVPAFGELRLLLQPDYLRRDLQAFGTQLGLDGDQATILEVVLCDYVEGFEVAATPLREALTHYERAATDQWLAEALQRIELADAATVADRIRRAVAEWDPPADAETPEQMAARRARVEATTRRMVEATRSMDERLVALRERVARDLTRLGDAPVTARDLVRLARQLTIDRAGLRRDVEDLLSLLTTEAQRGPSDETLRAVVSRVLISRWLPNGRLAAESMDLWAAAAATTGTDAAPGPAPGVIAAALDARVGFLFPRFSERTESSVAREIAGLEMLAAQEQEGDTAAAIRRFVDATRREVEAAVSARDALLSVLDTTAALVDDQVGRGYRDEAWRRGFPLEMRRRWCERALAAADGLTDLDERSREAIAGLRRETRAALDQVRTVAVAERLRRDPELARAQLELLASGAAAAAAGDAVERGKDERPGIGPERWLGMQYEAFAELDDRTEAQLRGILTSEQFSQLPPRRRTSGKHDKDDDATSKGAAAEKAADTRRGENAGTAGKAATAG